MGESEKSSGAAGAAAEATTGDDDASFNFTLEDWMKAWQPAGDKENANSLGGLSAELDEKFEQEESAHRERQHAAKRQRLDAQLKEWRVEAPKLVDSLEEATKALCKEQETLLAGRGDDARSRDFQGFRQLEEQVVKSLAACEACLARREEFHTHLVADASDGLAAVTMLQQRLDACRDSFEAAKIKVNQHESQLEARRREEADRVMALVVEADDARLFATYDRDGDGLLNIRELLAYSNKEANFSCNTDRMAQLLREAGISEASAASSAEFPRVRLLIAVAAVTEALDGVEAEVVKAEVKARPLSARGRAAVPLDQLGDAVAELDASLEAATDYLGAAGDQLQVGPKLGGGDEKVQALRKRLKSLEDRLSVGRSISKSCHDRLELQRRKAALLNSL
eukprot:TRINITY_DN28707_c2_g1_i1.p1 TRINITY_DN28707_c2_g1~~TRINITY_DN28707_c2_g1_i1.p1  ORF type:complete len:397 (+),score=109.80 TRINITY_DN28707_c2_g1_i1:132-1322(+)